MKLIILIFFLTSCSTSPVTAPAIHSPVKVTENELLKDGPNYDRSYSLSDKECHITWMPSGARNGSSYNLSLRYRPGSKCPSFKKQLPLHHEILSNVFKDQEKLLLQNLLTGSFYHLEPTFTWNVPIAALASRNPEWEDYTRNYPRHSGRRSINDLFVELVNNSNAYKELKELFELFGKKIELVSVEKVFAQKMNELPFKEQLAAQGVRYKRSLMYDAGMLVFRVQDSGR